MPPPKGVKYHMIGLTKTGQAKHRPVVREPAAKRKPAPDTLRYSRYRAAKFFTPAQMEARLAEKAETVAEEETHEVPWHCWACGKPAPCRKTTVAAFKRAGWVAREHLTEGGTRGSYREIERYCPDCFRKYGWPEVRALRGKEDT